MATLHAKSLDSPDELRPFTVRGEVEIVRLGEVTIGRGVAEPGWRWSEHVKSLAGTESCRRQHTGYVISERMHIVMDDGVEGEAGPGHAFVIPPGHDAWIVGSETCSFLGFTGMGSYARR